MNNWLFVGFSRIFLLGILIFKGLTALRLYKLFGVKGLNWTSKLCVGQIVTRKLGQESNKGLSASAG
jgi:hypothetical protein